MCPLKIFDLEIFDFKIFDWKVSGFRLFDWKMFDLKNCDWSFLSRAQHLGGIVPVVHQPITSLVETRLTLVRSTVEPHGALESTMPNLEALLAIAMFDLTNVLSNEVRGVGPGVPAVT